MPCGCLDLSGRRREREGKRRMEGRHVLRVRHARRRESEGGRRRVERGKEIIFREFRVQTAVKTKNKHTHTTTKNGGSDGGTVCIDDVGVCVRVCALTRCEMSDGDSVKKGKRKKGESVDRRNAPRPLTQILPLFIRRRFRGRQQRNTHIRGKKPSFALPLPPSPSACLLRTQARKKS